MRNIALHDAVLFTPGALDSISPAPGDLLIVGRAFGLHRVEVHIKGPLATLSQTVATNDSEPFEARFAHPDEIARAGIAFGVELSVTVCDADDPTGVYSSFEHLLGRTKPDR